MQGKGRYGNEAAGDDTGMRKNGRQRAVLNERLLNGEVAGGVGSGASLAGRGR